MSTTGLSGAVSMQDADLRVKQAHTLVFFNTPRLYVWFTSRQTNAIGAYGSYRNTLGELPRGVFSFLSRYALVERRDRSSTYSFLVLVELTKNSKEGCWKENKAQRQAMQDFAGLFTDVLAQTVEFWWEPN